MKIRPFLRRVRLMVLGGLLAASASAVTFGGLNVVPRGPQNLNLATGVTELPQGGTATDSKSGMTLSATRMELAGSERLTAQQATLKLRGGGVLSAAKVVYDAKAGILTATGNVTFSDARLRDLRAPTIRVALKTGFITATGGVKAAVPALSAASVVFDPHTVQAFMVGPAKVQQGSSAASAPAGGNLLVVFSGPRVTRVTSNADAGTRQRFAPYLP